MSFKHATGCRLAALLLIVWPVYQIVGTARHELSHALVAHWQGATITGIRIFPSWTSASGFYWGWASWRGGQTTWLATAAPYLCDLLTAMIFFGVCRLLLRRDWWLWFHCWVFGLWSPFLNSAYNYGKAILPKPRGDVLHLMMELPRAVVHAWFIVTLLLYAIAVWVNARARSHHDQCGILK